MLSRLTPGRFALIIVAAATVVLGTVGAVWSAAGTEDLSDHGIAEQQAAIDQHYQDLHDAGLASPRPRPEDPGLIDEGPTTAWEAGLFADPEYPGTGFAFTTEWVESTDQFNTAAFAGASYSDPNSGLLIVIQQDRKDGTNAKAMYEPPIGKGTLTIVKAGKSVLDIVSADGTLLSFDLVRRTWSKAHFLRRDLG